MKEKKFRCKVSPMRLAKKVREFAGLNPWNMNKHVKRKSIQAYLKFERDAKRLTLNDYFLLERIYLEFGGNKLDFEALARKCADEK